MAKTIKEIADELGVSKTAVSKQIANLGLRSSLRKKRKPVCDRKPTRKVNKNGFSEKKTARNSD